MNFSLGADGMIRISSTSQTLSFFERIQAAAALSPDSEARISQAMAQLIPDAPQRFQGASPQPNMGQARQDFTAFLFSRHAPGAFDEARLLTLRLENLDNALAFLPHAALSEFVGRYISLASLRDETISELVYTYLDPSSPTGVETHVFRLFAYRNLQMVENPVHRFMYTLIWGLVDIPRFALYLKTPERDCTLRLIQLELIIRLKAMKQEVDPSIEMGASQALALTYALGLVSIGDRWYFPSFDQISRFAVQDQAFHPQYLHKLYYLSSSIAVSFSEIETLLQSEAGPIAPFSSRKYVPQTGYHFPVKNAQLGQFMNKGATLEAGEFFSKGSLPFLDVFSVITLYGDTTVQMELPGLDVAMKLEKQMADGVSERIPLPSQQFSETALGHYLQVLAFLDVPIGSKLSFPVHIFDEIEVFEDERQQKFIQDIQQRQIQISDDSSIFGLQFLPAFYLTGSIFFNASLKQAFSFLLSFLFSPTPDSLFALTYQFKAQFYVSNFNSPFHKEIQGFSRTVYFNLLQQLYMHCDDWNSLLSLFGLYYDFDPNSQHTKTTLSMIGTKILSLKKPHLLPRDTYDTSALREAIQILYNKIDIPKILSLEGDCRGFIAPVVIENITQAAQYYQQIMLRYFGSGPRIDFLLPNLVSPLAQESKNLIIQALLVYQKTTIPAINAARLFLDYFECNVPNYVLLRLCLVRYFDQRPSFSTFLATAADSKAYSEFVFESYLPPYNYRCKANIAKKWAPAYRFNLELIKGAEIELVRLGFVAPLNQNFWVSG
ncbi:hypothetical protein SS50377_20411 [Spironucleus salmonicida]|uniref:Uncharacterized protein n=1 Tax=Spironucleus salmonicida TaxID=348837 RepID=A0A9P8LZY3_9EUKA|nr:hypothetical protein SS50377_20404 [Spironucleus salmonicida]KAH0577063.1 hypothetical protein SS50377_20411 [Spironucleus salmonicida]